MSDKPKYKVARPIYFLDCLHCVSNSNQKNRLQEKRIAHAAEEPEDNVPLRSKRGAKKSFTNTSWETQWIKRYGRPKSWKSRCRKAKQWIHHKMSEFEEKYIRGLEI